MTALEQIYQTEYGAIHYWVYRRTQEAKWLVFLPGLTADSRLFQQQIDELSDTYNCIVWDPPAHGQSRPFALSFTMTDMARYLHEILAAEGIEQPIFVGQSMGGFLSQVYMEQYPGTVSGFVSIDSCSMNRSYYHTWELVFLKHTKWMYLSIPWKMLVYWSAVGNAESEYGRALMKDIMESYEKREFCALAAYGFRILANAVETERYNQINCPVLLLCGEKDGAGFVKSLCTQWAEREHLPLIWLEHAGHNSNTDAPEEVNRHLRNFIESL